ncbi:MAG TPA: hypothetical protein VFB12_32245 [Ktedonobacteraceae bacterium]|nr:hypothetical protein [Ktedonobacteraceae bacterium]
MSQSVVTVRSSQASIFGFVFTRLYGIVSFGLLCFIFAQFVLQVANPLPAHQLELVQDIALPSALPVKFLPQIKNVPLNVDPLAPGVAVRYDHFDFQALDPNTGLLFIAHTGPSPDKFALGNPQFNPDKDSQVDGHVLVFDTRQNKITGRVDIPQVTGMVAAPDLARIFAVDSHDNLIYSIDEHTLKFTAIDIGNNEGPDSIGYDQRDHIVTISDRGVPNPTNADPKNQNISLIDTRTNHVTKINIGHLPLLPNEHVELARWGYGIGHNYYDPGLQRLFVSIQQLTDQSNPNPPLPPASAAELLSIDPVAKVITGRLALPSTCGMPHGMTIDTQQHIAFVACTEIDPDHRLVQNLVRVDLRSMKVIPDPILLLAIKPDIVALDRSWHVLYVACSMGISVFDVHGRTIHKLGDYILGKSTHTITVNEVTHYIYLPLTDAGGRPTLRIARYNPDGV